MYQIHSNLLDQKIISTLKTSAPFLHTDIVSRVFHVVFTPSGRRSFCVTERQHQLFQFPTPTPTPWSFCPDLMQKNGNRSRGNVQPQNNTLSLSTTPSFDWHLPASTLGSLPNTNNMWSHTKSQDTPYNKMEKVFLKWPLLKGILIITFFQNGKFF